ncbi:hypothetical protein EYF80_058331 [Liparis tanakae]|uniref:Uncharacterized protein n=1 Tax=Liparis tanakae TaxID=230148 RepID=A0A4Z2ERI4_9TELE|nr:hypothetical protein EYF80_058331 [Liparis tanakae]
MELTCRPAVRGDGCRNETHEEEKISYGMIWRGVVGKQGLLRNPELIWKWMQVCSSHTQPARYRDGKHPEWLSDRAAMAQLVARMDHNRRMRR